MTSTNSAKLEYIKSRVENEFMNTEVVIKNNLRIHRDVYLKDIDAENDEIFDLIKSTKVTKKFELLICTETEAVLLAINITDGEVDRQGYRISTFEFDVDQMGDWTVKTIESWVERKLEENEEFKYKYNPKKGKKRVKRIPLQDRIDSLLEDLL